ncbi:MAG TPA: RES family NAD+ phosphorylase [Verrucomicrobiae bacterium]|jgi:RES domain-containing protein|nr:RES family NAD+ phosphorylase [Verrucomicrobiae bacterium]
MFRVAGYASESMAPLASLLDDPDSDLDGVLAILALTDNVAREANDVLASMEPDDRYTGNLASLIMLPFVHPYRARFNDVTFGAWYAADTVKTAYEEKAYHLTQWLLQSSATPLDLKQRVVRATIGNVLHDARRGPAIPDAVYDPNAYDASNAFARDLKTAGSNGIIYDSVRHVTGTCVGVFRPAIIRDPSVQHEILLEWRDGSLAGFEAI